MISNNLSSMSSYSYTSKDFESIYPELLDLVKVLTYRWDPSISNESDPGVILLKLNAIIADKCNYNSDKNVLECFPSSVTQPANARKLFAQLGYFMHWYKSATTNISLKWVASTLDYSYDIPAFTMVSTEDKSVVYTLLGPVINGTSIAIASQDLKCDGNPVIFNAIQGVAVTYAINGDTLITANYLDNNNRLYFDSTDVAQNGIFITNQGENNYSAWVQKDNLVAEALGNTFYKFGVSDDGTSCYIEFPEDIESLIRNGINITYIKTLGYQGNVKAKDISVFYNDIAVTSPQGDKTTLNSTNVYISNPSSTSNGDDIESIDEAYRGYERTVGTFNTLVTLRDYINYILRSNLVSNGFVCDRTNDIQCTYRIISNQDGVDQSVNYIRESTGSPELNAFSLKLYLTNYSDVFYPYSQFDSTFNLVSNTKLQTIKDYLQEQKSISHDYSDILPRTDTELNLCYVKVKCDISCDVVTQYELSTTEINSLKQTIKEALYNNFNARKLNFGDQISYEDITEVVQQSDKRIKLARIAPLSYSAWAVYYDGKDFVEVNISDDSNLFAVDAPSYLSVNVNRPVFEQKVGIGDYSKVIFTYDGSVWKVAGAQVILSDYGLTVAGTAKDGDNIIITPSVKIQAREEIYAKSVLAGRTQLLVEDEPFEYDFSQTYTQGETDKTVMVSNIESISTNVTLTLDQTNNEYQLRENETLQLYAPNMIDKASYGDYVKFEYYISQDIPANTSYQLSADDYIIFYWKNDDSATALYNYAVYGQGNVIQPTFAISAQQFEASVVGASLKANLRNIGSVDPPILFASSEEDGDMTVSLSQQVQKLDATHILSGKNKVVVRVVNSVTLTSPLSCYWILNNSENDRYVLFEKGSDSKTYMLDSGEYFFYTDAQRSDLAILGAGTRISITDNSIEYSVPVLDSSTVISNGVDAIDGSWFAIPENSRFNVVETYFLNISPGSVIRFVPNISFSSWKVQFDSSNVLFEGGPKSLSDFDIMYKTSPTDQDWTCVQQINFTTYSGWSGRPLLGLNLSSDTQQILLANQQVTCNLLDGTSKVINGADISNLKYPVCLESIYPVSVNGAQKVNATYYIDDELYYQELYIYGIYVDGSFENVSYSSARDVVVTLPSTNSMQSAYFDFMIPDGEYIVTLENLQDNVSQARVLLDGVALNKVQDDSDSNLSAKGVYNLSMKIDSSSPLPAQQQEHRMTVELTSSGESKVSIRIRNPYRYTMPQHFKSIDNGSQLFKDVQKLISKLDPKSLYDWSYHVPEISEVEEPLDPYSFFNQNHIYNKFTICELNPVLDSSIRILGKR